MLRILLIEDSEDDADLLRLALEEAGLDFELHRVFNERGLRSALRDFAADVAVSDMNLPGYSGLAALTLVNAQHPELPLILLSGDDCATTELPATVVGKAQMGRLPAMLIRIVGSKPEAGG